MSRENTRLIFAAGGTGGHLFPALAVADECRELEPEIEILFAGAVGKMEEVIVPKYGYNLETLPIQGLNRQSLVKNISLPGRMLRSLSRAKSIIRKFDPGAVVCAGAYVSWPIGRAAIAGGVPLILMESNAHPGMVTRKLSARARVVYASFEQTISALPGAIVEVVGNPVRMGLVKSIDKSEAVKSFGLNPEYPVLFAFGGSQGAQSINRALASNLDKIIGDGIQLIWQTGRNFDEKISDREGLYMSTFIHDMGAAYSAADLILSRAGATTIAELRTVGKPSVLVPLPSAAEDHQSANALALQSERATEVLEETELELFLAKTIIRLLNSPEILNEMGENAKRGSTDNAGSKIAKSIIEIANQHRLSRVA